MKRRDWLKGAAAALGCLNVGRSAGGEHTIHGVAGPIAAASLGRTLMHEHVLVDMVGASGTVPGRYDGGEVRTVVLPYLEQLRAQGCNTFVDCTPAYQGRDPELLARLARASGLQILATTGLYGAMGGKFLPDYASTATAEALAARWTAEYRTGIGRTGICAGLIKIGVDSGPLSKIASKLVSAAALTHLQTGMAIMAHTGDGVAAMAQLGVLKSHGVPASAFIWAHAQDEKDWSLRRKAAEAGAWIEYDGISSSTLDSNIKLIVEAKRAGHLRRVLISQDSVGYQVGQAHGGSSPGYGFLFTEFLSRLRKSGIDEGEVRLLTVENPRRALGGE